MISRPGEAENRGWTLHPLDREKSKEIIRLSSFWLPEEPIIAATLIIVQLCVSLIKKVLIPKQKGSFGR